MGQRRITNYLFPRLALFLIVGAVLIRLTWGWHVRRLVNNELDGIKSRAEWSSVSEVPWPTVDDSQNAWLAEQRAAAAISPLITRNVNMIVSLGGIYPPFHYDTFAVTPEAEKASIAAYDLARRARDLPEARIGGPSIAPFDLQSPPFINVRALTGLLGKGATAAHLRADDREAIERLLDLMHLARCLRQDHSLSAQFMGIGVEAVCCESVLTIAASMDISGTAQHDAVRKLMDELLDEKLIWQELPLCVQYERLMDVQAIRARSVGAFLIQPMSEMAVLRGLRGTEPYVQAATLGTCEALRRLPSGWFDDIQPTMSISITFPSADVTWTSPRYSRLFTPAEPHPFNSFFADNLNVIAERRAAATALAIWLYRADHGGEFPDSLSSLAPAYLPRVPDDPMSNGQSIGYVKIGVRPMLCFGPNNAADPGPPNSPTFAWYTYLPGASGNILRQYRDLTMFSASPNSFPAPAPARLP